MSDDGSWNEYTKSVKPLKKARAYVRSTPSKHLSVPLPFPPFSLEPREMSKLIDMQDIQITAKFSTSYDTRKEAADALKLGNKANLYKSLRKKMDAGLLKIEGVLDLHGHSRETAFDVFKQFINEAYKNGKRMLLIITGKGTKSEYNIAILKNELPHWLDYGEIREKILEFVPAQQKHGGEGAFYIFLKRKRAQ